MPAHVTYAPLPTSPSTPGPRSTSAGGAVGASDEPLAMVYERARALAEALTDPRTPGDWEPLARALEHGLEAGGMRRASSPSARRRAVGELVVVALDARRRRPANE